VSAIGLAARNVAHRAIEEAMLAANRAIADLLVEERWPTLHRVHEPPDPAELAGLEPVLASLGLWPGRMRRAPGASDLPDLVDAVRERDDAGVVHGLLVRAMRQARYAESPLGHFALGFERYLHFTSPIRRYADLAVHRVVKRYLSGERNLEAGDPTFEALALHLNRAAYHATKAEIDRHRMLVARLFASRVGERLAGNIVSIKPFGLVVQMKGTGAQGTVAMDVLPEGPYRIAPGGHVLVSETRRYGVGEPLEVVIAATNEGLGRVELTLASS
jgi:ribonuclease R